MILVFGKTGQVARELQKLKSILALDRLQADLTEPQTCANVINQYKPSAVINAAAYTNVDMAEENEELANLINSEAPSAMAKACANLNIPFIQISTDYVFEGIGEKEWSTIDPTNPKNEYGRSKLKGEKHVQVSGASYAILRTSWIISAYGNNFVKTMLRLSQTRDTLNVVDNQIGGPTPAKDIANACIDIAHQLINAPNKSGIYHLTGFPDLSWCQFANAIFKQTGRKTVALPISTYKYPTNAQRPLNSRMDCSLTESVFDIARPYWRDGLQDILNDLEVKYDKT